MIYADRKEAGRRLAAALQPLRQPGLIIYGLPRGGLPVAREVADALGAPLEALPVRKVGVPSFPELAMGALASGSGRVVIEETVREFRVPPEELEAAVRREAAQLAQREALYRAGRGGVDPRGRAAILVDDGLATGATMVAAVRSLRARGAARIVAAAPVGSAEACAWLSREADETVCPETPRPFTSVGQWYESFDPVDDAEALACLAGAVTRRS